MKKILSILFLSAFVLSSFAQHNYMQELIDHLQQGRCFEARELRMQHADKLPPDDRTLDLVYKSHMALFFNKPDSAIIYMEELVANHELQLGPITGSYYGKLLQTYENEQRFEEEIELCDRVIAYFKRNPFDMEQEFLQNEFALLEKIKSTIKGKVNEPRIRVERNQQNHLDTLKLSDSEYIRFNNAKYNGVPLETWFDTGVTFPFFMMKNLADEMGVKVLDTSQDSIKTINGIPTKAIIGVIDSIDLGSVQLYNIPVMVFDEVIMSHMPDTLNHDVRTNVKDAFSDKRITMGLPVMKLIGKIEFDREKRTVSFPENTKRVETNNSPNMFFIDNNPYIRLKINGLGYSGQLDTGSNDFVNVAFSFYERNKSHIEIDSMTQKGPLNRFTLTNSTFDVPHELIKDAKVYFNGKHINEDGSIVVISDRTPWMNTYDGVVGVDFFKKLGSKTITFDFDNMRVDGL